MNQTFLTIRDAMETYEPLSWEPHAGVCTCLWPKISIPQDNSIINTISKQFFTKFISMPYQTTKEAKRTKPLVLEKKLQLKPFLASWFFYFFWISLMIFEHPKEPLDVWMAEKSLCCSSHHTQENHQCSYLYFGQ